MAVILRMSEHLANKIAAGEVIERPASVVKELVENAIDAGATVLDIVLEQAGTQLIQVSDNGSGMEFDDALRAFERHATSKLHDEYELFHIQTLGFRGEALPSIASVAKVSLQTSTGETGTKVVIHGGKLQVHESAAAKKGTLIRVEQLFYNTPARLKYLKTATTEVNHVLDYVSKTALAQPQLRLRLQHNGKILFQSSGNNDLKQVLAMVYAVPVAKSAVAFEAKTPDVSIHGYAALPEHQKTNRNAMTLAINGRVIKNYAIQRAIIEAYYTMIPDSRFPIVVLNIQMDPGLLDVNVHPAKLEVRLSQEAALQLLVKETIRASLQQLALIPSIVKVEKPNVPNREQTQLWQPERPNLSSQKTDSGEGSQSRPDELNNEKTQQWQPNKPWYNHDKPTRGEVQQAIQAYQPPSQNYTQTQETQVFEQAERVTMNAAHSFDHFQTFVATGDVKRFTIRNQTQELIQALENPETTPAFPMMQVIGQLFGTYILAQGEAMFYLIDQHAAQERIKYEQFMAALQRQKIHTQTLLVPFTFEVSAVDFHFLNEQLDKLVSVGVEAESFGMQSFIIRQLPTFIPNGQEHEYISAMFELLLQQRKIDSVKLQEAAAIMQSCKKSIKANHSLTLVEMQTLIQQLAKCEQPYNCPHGRPIVVQHRQYELEKWFKRVM